MKNAREFATSTLSKYDGLAVNLGNLEAEIAIVMRDVMAECQEIAKRVMQSPRTEILKMQPQDAKLMTPHDCWVKAADSIIKNIEQLKRAQ